MLKLLEKTPPEVNESACQESNSELREFKIIEKMVSTENTEDKATKMQPFDQSSMERDYQQFLEVHSTANPTRDSKNEISSKALKEETKNNFEPQIIDQP